MLPPRKAAFVQAYLSNGGNATEAAKSAGYSAKTAYSQGSRLLKDVEVAAELNKVVVKAAGKLNLTAEVVLQELLRIGTVDVATFYDKDGKIHKIKLAPKTEALRELARHLGLFEKDNAQQGKSFAETVLAAQRAREKR